MADIREWRTHDVLDAAGRRIGVLEAVQVDTSTGEPAMVTVQIGLPTRHRLVFVPLDGASVGPGHVKGAHDKALVKDCPSIGMGDVLPFEDEEAVFQHYGLPASRGRTASGSWPAAELPRPTEEVSVVTLFLAVLVVAMVLGLIGATAEGLFYLLIIGIVLLAADVVHFGLRLRHSSRRPFAEVRVGGSAVALVAPALPRIPGVIMTSVSRVGPALGW